ncbi:transcriptional regulator, TetR family [Sesbania bispinosa]|nr:transcriptional regulator, TetR family [Sesbania bispinosa]
MRLGILGSSRSSVTTKQFHLFLAVKALAFALVIMVPPKIPKCRRLEGTGAEQIPPKSIEETSLNSSKNLQLQSSYNSSNDLGTVEQTRDQMKSVDNSRNEEGKPRVTNTTPVIGSARASFKTQGKGSNSLENLESQMGKVKPSISSRFCIFKINGSDRSRT